MNINAAALASGPRNDGQPPSDNKQVLDDFMRGAKARARLDMPDQPKHTGMATNGQSEMTEDTITLPVSYTMISPDIKSDDDDGALSLPTPIPIQIQVNVDFPKAALEPGTTTASMPPVALQDPAIGQSGDLSRGDSVDPTRSHSEDPSPRDSSHTSRSQSGDPSRGDSIDPTRGHSGDLSRAMLASPDVTRATSPTKQGEAATTTAIDTPASVHNGAAITPPTEKDETARRLHAALGASITPQAMTTHADTVNIEGRPTQQSSNYPAHTTATPAENAGDPPADRALAGGPSETGSLDQGSSDSVEMTYRFSSWGAAESVSLKLDRIHPGAQMQAAASSGHVHKVLADALDQSRQGMKDRPAMRLTSDAIEDISERADERSREQ